MTSSNNQHPTTEEVRRPPKNNSKRIKSQRAPNASKGGIAFVNLTGSSGPIQDAEKRRVVRAHVMRDYQRKKQQEEINYRVSLQQRFVDTFSSPLTFEQQRILYENALSKPTAETTSIFITKKWSTNTVLESQKSSPAQDVGYSDAPREGKWSSFQSFRNHGNADRTRNMDHKGEAFKEVELDFESLEYPPMSQSLTLKLSFDALNSGKLDPFNAMPGLRNAQAQALMYHYNNVLVQTLIPVNPKDKWFNFAISDEALFCATMLHSAAHNAMLVGNNELADPFQLNAEAIRILNSRLGDPSKSVDDLTIAAVACLILFENQSGNILVSNIHMAGLERMIQLRGGIENLGLSGVLKRKVLWADVCNAMLSNKKPRFNLLHGDRTINTNSSDTIFGAATLVPSVFCDCDPQLTEIMVDLQSLSDNPPINALDGLISDKLYLVERRLVMLIVSFDDGIHTSYCRSDSKACFLAALIYLYTCLRDYPTQAPLFDSFTTTLAEALFSPSYSQDWAESRYSMLLWVLTTGALTAEGRPERTKFARELARLMTKKGIASFYEFVASAREILWIERRDERREAAWRSLWWECQAFIGEP